MLVEVLVALILLATVATMVPLLLRTVYQQRHQERFCRFAQIELANIAIRLRAGDTEKDAPDKVVLSDWFQQYCPDATMKVTAVESSEPFPGTQSYQIAISRPNGEARPDLSQMLTVWLRESEELSE